MIEKVRAALDELEFKRMLPGEFDASGAILEISSGAGGIDAEASISAAICATGRLGM